MSFLTKTAVHQVSLISRAAAIAPTTRQFSIGTPAQKSVAEVARDTLKSVDRKVSDKLVDGINAGENLASKVRGEAESDKVKGTAEEIRGTVKGEAEALKGKAKGAVGEVEGKVKGNL
ncbi:hypothetical protein GGS23DRAFT_565794 [Durotheca rogersii]|uniref:uncharacterized protein n=1 Tax=Durotheca rogersii TaxID=419775 RepID=UPI00221FBFA0|nr:uncharacterized protein GGS23DRAFT_565794 [Durotheca rogersii]KAI5863877.1 hypothetical protein GGS23DRAFT_565794 [Durotheca rogersii]